MQYDCEDYIRGRKRAHRRNRTNKKVKGNGKSKAKEEPKGSTHFAAGVEHTDRSITPTV